MAIGRRTRGFHCSICRPVKNMKTHSAIEPVFAVSGFSRNGRTSAPFSAAMVVGSSPPSQPHATALGALIELEMRDTRLRADGEVAPVPTHARVARAGERCATALEQWRFSCEGLEVREL